MNHVWLVGTFEGTEAAEVPAWAIDAFQGATFRHFCTPRMAVNGSGEPADVVVVVQHRPREFAVSAIAALIASQPLAQFLVGLGPWCGSSVRSEAAWPESVAIPLWYLRGSLRRIASSLEHGEVLTPWQTSGREEMFLSERELFRGSSNPRAPQREVRIESVDGVFAESLRDIVRQFVTAEDATHASGITLWDADPLAMRLASLTELRRKRRTDRIVALVDQPTRSTIEQLTRAGADAVVAKPFRLAELLGAISPHDDFADGEF